MQITYRFLGNGRSEIRFGDSGALTCTLARAFSRDANTFTNTVEAGLFAKVVAFAGGGSDDQAKFENLRRFAVGFEPEGMSAKSTKAKRVEQKANVASLAAAFN